MHLLHFHNIQFNLFKQPFLIFFIFYFKQFLLMIFQIFSFLKNKYAISYKSACEIGESNYDNWESTNNECCINLRVEPEIIIFWNMVRSAIENASINEPKHVHLHHQKHELWEYIYVIVSYLYLCFKLCQDHNVAEC